MFQSKDGIPVECEDDVENLSSYFTAMRDEISMISFRFFEWCKDLNLVGFWWHFEDNIIVL